MDIRAVGDDEIGRLSESVRSSVRSLKDIIEDITYILTEVSAGNLAVPVEGNYIGDFRFIREALEQIIAFLNDTLRQINISAEQVSCGSEQVSAGAQTLSRGAAEQAGSVEELAAVINDLFPEDYIQCGPRLRGQPLSRKCGRGGFKKRWQDAGAAECHTQY